MANLSISTARPVKTIEQMTGPANEAIALGQAARLDDSTGRYTKANGTTAAEAQIAGVAITAATQAKDTTTVVAKGTIDVGDALDSMNYGDAVYLSDTDGTLADSAGTVSVVVGTVVPAWGATTGDKLLNVNL